MSDQWQPISTATAVGKKRLMFWAKGGRIIVGYRLAGTNVVISQDNASYTATHWQPLPTPPQAEDQDQSQESEA